MFSDLINYIRECGFDFDLSEENLDGMRHDFKTDTRKGWYRGDKFSWGYRISFGDWRTGEHFKHTIKSSSGNPEEDKKIEAEISARLQEQNRVNTEISERVASDSAQKFLTLSETGTSKYLKRKHLNGNYGCRYAPSEVDVMEQDLYVPMRDIRGKWWGYQIIRPEGDKDFLPGAKVSDTFHLLGGEPDKVLFIAEGLATAASIHEATGKSVACAFNAFNLKKVALAFREKYPKVRIIIAADDDRFGEKNTGRIAAKETSEAVRGVYVLPRFKDPKSRLTDFNDLHISEGLDAVKKQLGRRVIEPRNQFNIQSFADMLKEPEEELDFLVHGLLPRAGTSIVAGPPKVGKTTLARQLAVAVARGEEFLGRSTEKGAVLYLALEEKHSEIRRHFLRLGLTSQDNVDITCTMPYENQNQQLEHVLTLKHYDLVIIDTLFKFVSVEDGNSYQEVVNALRPLEDIARDSGAHLCLVHHSKKTESKDPIETLLGSTAIAAAVDTIVGVSKQRLGEREERVVQTRNRYGDPVEASVLSYNKEQGRSVLGPGLGDAEKMQNEARVLSALSEIGGAASSSDLKEAVGGNDQKRADILQALVQSGRVSRLGNGTKTNPFKYEINQNWKGNMNETDRF